MRYFIERRNNTVIFKEEKEPSRAERDPTTSRSLRRKSLPALAQTRGTWFPPVPHGPRAEDGQQTHSVLKGQGPLSPDGTGRLERWLHFTDWETEAQRDKVT